MNFIELIRNLKELEGTKQVLEETIWNLKQSENDIRRLERERIDGGF